jgi:DNA-binding MarR family transcriptional regulator
VPRYNRADALKSPDYRVLADFREHLRRFLHFSEQAAKAAGVETQQYQLMLAIKGSPKGTEPTIGELARRMLIKHHSCVGLVDRLVENGLVERTRNSADRRQIIVRLTPKGERVLRRLYEHHARELKALAPELIRSLANLLAASGDAVT